MKTQAYSSVLHSSTTYFIQKKTWNLGYILEHQVFQIVIQVIHSNVIQSLIN